MWILIPETLGCSSIGGSPSGPLSTTALLSMDPLATLSNAGGQSSTISAPNRTSSTQYTESLRPWEVRWDEIALDKKIGGGSFGKVCVCVLGGRGKFHFHFG
jgi:hypothetical protein